MASKASLSVKLTRIGMALLLIGLASIGMTLWFTWQIEGGAAAVNEAGRMRMQTWRLTSAVQAGRSGSEVHAMVLQFDQSLKLLQDSDPARPLFVPWNSDVRRAFSQVQRLWPQQRSLWLDEAPPPAAVLRASADNFVQSIDGFVSDIEQRLARFTALLNLLQMLMMALVITGAVVMLYMSYLYVIHPIDRLRRSLLEVEGGQFGTRIEVDTQDEFGQVAAGFNRMAATLQSLYEGLEASVAAKTQHIEAQRARLEALYAVSAFLAKANTAEEVAKGFAQRVRAAMKVDAVVVRWADEANQRYLMLAADQLPPELQAGEDSIACGSCSCGNLQPDSPTRVIAVHGQHDRQAPPCARLGFQGLVSVPIRLHQRIMGEINLLRRDEVSLAPEEVELLDALASHLANALEGLRAAALEREAAVGGERALLARELHDSIAQSLAFLKIQAQLLRSAVQRQQADKIQSTLDELDAGLKESIGDVRELLMHFRIRTNTEDIESALQETLQKFQHQTGLPARLQVHGEGLPLPADVQVQVLHILQEALSNVRKHAHAGHVALSVHKGPQWRFRVRDDGTGFDIGERHGETHVGIKIMRERAERIGALVRLDSSAGQGTTVTLELPRDPVAARQLDALQRNLSESPPITP